MIKKSLIVLKIILINISVLLLSCSENTLNPFNVEHEYYFYAKVDNSVWTGKSYLNASNSEKQTLFLRKENSYSYIRITFTFNGIGKYEIDSTDAALMEFIGDDIISGMFYSFGENDDNLTIVNFDDEKKIIEGRYSFKVQKENFYKVIKGLFKSNINE